MSYTPRGLALASGGLRMVRFAWIFTLSGSFLHALTIALSWSDETSPPWLTLLGLALSVVGLLRCGLGARTGAERLWIGLSALCVGLGILQATPGSVVLGYLGGAFCFHLFLIQLAREVGCSSEAGLMQLLVLPFLTLAVTIFTGLFLRGFGTLLLLAIFLIGPLAWVVKLLILMYQLERTLA